MDPLEWSRIIELLSELTRTEPGADAIVRLEQDAHWMPDAATAQLAQHETSEAYALLKRDGIWSVLSDLEDPEDSFERLDKDSTLSLHELALIKRWLSAIEVWADIPLDEIKGERFKRALKSLPYPRDAAQLLGRILNSDGTLSESATPRLRELHHEIRNLTAQIRIRLEQVVKRWAQAGLLQDALSDVRDGRYVVPVKISKQSEAEGTLYEASSSGQTVYIEPREIAELNQALSRKHSDLNREILELLVDTSKRLKPLVSELRIGTQTLTHWDAVQARARLGSIYGGKPIQIAPAGAPYWQLRSTAHPLLWWTLPHEKIERNTIELSGSQRALLLTGANTGGKTVFLKTMGLAAIFARTGLFFPGEETQVVPFIESIYTDLGDPQSLENQLSSFAGHVLRFKSIVEGARAGSLVLLDELNSATDPEEGAALGRAILESILDQGAWLVSTTHDPRLKAHAPTDPRIQCASVSFDAKTATPTYRLLLGVPGRSRALETAERLGLPESLLSKARSYLTAEHQAVESRLEHLERDLAEATRARRQAESAAAEAETLKAQWMERSRQSAQELFDKTRQRLRRMTEQFQDEIRSALKRLEETRGKRDFEIARASIRAASESAEQEIRKIFEEEAPEVAQGLNQSSETSPQTDAPTVYHVGDPVRVRKLQSVGVIGQIDGEIFTVNLGKMSMKLKYADIEAVSEQTARNLGLHTERAPRSSAMGSAPLAPEAQLDLRGVRFEEAMMALDLYLDQAFRSRAHTQVTIIHGLGTGALREGTRQKLKKLPYVKSYRDGGIGGGGTGATIVEFDL